MPEMGVLSSDATVIAEFFESSHDRRNETGDQVGASDAWPYLLPG